MTRRPRVPVVDYLVLEPTPHLVAHRCSSCGERFFDHRDACASCFGQEFEDVPVPTHGTLVTFTIVAVARPGVEAPFVAGVVDCGGLWVRGNLREVAPDPSVVRLGMPLELTTFSLGEDTLGTEAVGFAFKPQTDRSDDHE